MVEKKNKSQNAGYLSKVLMVLMGNFKGLNTYILLQNIVIKKGETRI
mgnify:CR=1 FL=1